MEYKFDIDPDIDGSIASADLTCLMNGKILFLYSSTFDFWEKLAVACEYSKAKNSFHEVIREEESEITASVDCGFVEFTLDCYRNGNGGCISAFIPAEKYLKLYKEAISSRNMQMVYKFKMDEPYAADLIGILNDQNVFCINNSIDFWKRLVEGHDVGVYIEDKFGNSGVLAKVENDMIVLTVEYSTDGFSGSSRTYVPKTAYLKAWETRITQIEL